MPVKVKGHTRRNPNTATVGEAQVYVIPPEAYQQAEPRTPRLYSLKRMMRRRRKAAPPRTELDDLADEADEVARIINGLGNT